MDPRVRIPASYEVSEHASDTTNANRVAKFKLSCQKRYPGIHQGVDTWKDHRT
jgi:hypothetical protein